VSNGKTSTRRVVGMVLIAALLLALVLYSLLSVTWPTGSISQFTTQQFGLDLFNDYSFVVIMLGLVLFGAMLGGVFVAKEEDEE
jgi:NADH:ubiquinone oxidoreductase subunit 6 (subunit J)